MNNPFLSEIPAVLQQRWRVTLTLHPPCVLEAYAAFIPENLWLTIYSVQEDRAYDDIVSASVFWQFSRNISSLYVFESLYFQP